MQLAVLFSPVHTNLYRYFLLNPLLCPLRGGKLHRMDNKMHDKYYQGCMEGTVKLLSIVLNWAILEEQFFKDEKQKKTSDICNDWRQKADKPYLNQSNDGCSLTHKYVSYSMWCIRAWVYIMWLINERSWEHSRIIVTYQWIVHCDHITLRVISKHS